ncbi:MAG TPA: O-antigen ligase family protein [Patescibacteria group bacterium]|nr:O-antigen ligase family protein [Patescibacteria group bacterium]
MSILSIAQFHVKHDFGLKYFGEPELILGHPGVASVSHGTYRLLRPYATFPHPNVLAMVLAVGVLFLAFDVSRENITKSRFIRMLLLLLFLAVLVLTFSRGTMVSLLFAVSCGTLYSLLKEGGKMILRETFLIGIIVVLGIGFTLYAQATRYDLSDQSVSLRWELLKVSREVIIENPILGVGLGQVLPTYAFSGKEVFHTAWAIQPVHNFFILFILENGLPLFVIFSIYIVRRVRKWLKYIVSHDECFTWGAFLITVSMLDHYYYTLPQATAIFCIVLVVSQTLCAQKPLKQEV